MKYSVLVAFGIVAPLAATAQTTVFSDDFSGASTVQSGTPGAPTATSADYEVFTSTGAPPTPSLDNVNGLSFSSVATSSGFAEVMAQIPSTTLSVGDSLNLQITFTDVAGVLLSSMNNNSTLNVGMYNSGGVAPNVGEQLVNTGASVTTGGSQNWQGYVSRLFQNGNASSFNRKLQGTVAGSSVNQDLLFNSASSSSSFNNPGGTSTTGTSGTTLQNGVLIAGDQYTISYTLTLTAANAVKVEDKLYAGVGTGGTLQQDNIGTATSGNYLGATFDSFALGFRYAAASGTGTLDINDIDVTYNPAAVPEPTTLALSAFGGLGLLAVRRWKNRK